MLLARYLGMVPKLVEDPDIIGFRVVLNVGSPAPTVRSEPLPIDQLPPALTTTTTTPPPPGDGTVPEESSTTTTVLEGAPPDAAPPGIVPTDPEKAAACH